MPNRTTATGELTGLLRAAGGPLARHLAENGSRTSISGLAELLGRHPSDKALRGAITKACEEGYYVLEAGKLARIRPFRLARVCPKCSAREFGTLGWRCSTHGVAVDQPNLPQTDTPG
jgi:hypothetical protein